MRDRDILFLAGGAAVLYWLINKAGSVANTVAAPLANFYVWLTAQGAAVPQGVVVFPDFTTLPTANLPAIKWIGNTATFSYNGATWQLLPHDTNGNYPAVAYGA